MKPAAILKLVQDSLPAEYSNNLKLNESREYLELYEWELALDELTEMADESGKQFPTAFWQNLAICAEKMQLTQKAEYCRQQISESK